MSNRIYQGLTYDIHDVIPSRTIKVKDRIVLYYDIDTIPVVAEGKTEDEAIEQLVKSILALYDIFIIKNKNVFGLHYNRDTVVTKLKSIVTPL